MYDSMSDLFSTLTDLLQSSSKSKKELFQLILKEYSKMNLNDDDGLIKWLWSSLEDEAKVLEKWSQDEVFQTGSSLEDTRTKLHRIYDMLVAHLDGRKRDKDDFDCIEAPDSLPFKSPRKKKKEMHDYQYFQEDEEKRLLQMLTSILHLGTRKEENQWLSVLQSIQMDSLHFIYSIQRYIATPLTVISMLQSYLHHHLESKSTLYLDSLYLSTDIMFEYINSMLDSVQSEHENETQVTSMISLFRSMLSYNDECHEHDISTYCLLLVRNMLTILQTQPLFRRLYRNAIQKELAEQKSLCLLDTIAYLMLFYCEFYDESIQDYNTNCSFEEKKHCALILLKRRKLDIEMIPSASIIQFLRLILVRPNQWTEIDEVLWTPWVKMVVDTCFDLLLSYFLIPSLQSDADIQESSCLIHSMKEYILQFHSVLSSDQRDKLVHVILCAIDVGVHAINTYESTSSNHNKGNTSMKHIHRWADAISSYQDIIIDLIKNQDCRCHSEIKHRLDHLGNITWNDRKHERNMDAIEAYESIIEMYCISLVLQYETQDGTLDIIELYNMVQNNIFLFMENEKTNNGSGSINLGLILARFLIQCTSLSQELSESIVETVITFVSHQDYLYCDPVPCYYALLLLTSLCTETSSMQFDRRNHVSFQKLANAGQFVYSVDEVFGHIKDLVMRFRLVRKMDDEPQTKYIPSGFSVISFSDLPPYIRDEVKIKKNQSLVFSPVSMTKVLSLECPAKEHLINILMAWTRFAYELFNSYLVMGRILSRNKKWSRDVWMMAPFEFITKDQSPCQLPSICEFSVNEDYDYNEAHNTNILLCPSQTNIEDLRLWQNLFVMVAILGAVLKSSYTEVELDEAKSEDIHRIMFLVEKIYFLRTLIEIQEPSLIDVVDSYLFSVSGIISFSHLLACIRGSTIITKDHSALFRAFMVGTFKQSQHDPILKNVVHVLSINNSIMRNVLFILNHSLADKTLVHLKLCDIKTLVETVSSVLLWMNSLQAFFQCESYLSGRVEVSEPRLLFEVRGQMQIYIKRALLLVQYCAEHSDFKFLDLIQGQDLMAMASMCDDSTIRLQLFDTVSLILVGQSDDDTFLLESSWQLMTSTMISKDSLSDILLPPPVFHRICHQLRKIRHEDSLSSTVMSNLMTLDKKKMSEFQSCNALVHSFLAHWGCLMSKPSTKLDTLKAIVCEVNDTIQVSQAYPKQRRKNRDTGAEKLHLQGLKRESVYILYEVTLELIVATTYCIIMLAHRDVVQNYEALVSVLDCFGSMLRTLEICHDTYPKSTIYSCLRSFHLMVDICNALIDNFSCSDESSSRNRTSSSSKNWLSKMKEDCCDRIIELSNTLSRSVSVVEKATLTALRKKTQDLSVCIYKKGTPFHMVPSSLEMFGIVEPTSNQKPIFQRKTIKENLTRSSRNTKRHAEEPIQMNVDVEEEQDDDGSESFGATGDWGEVESSETDSDSAQINLELAL